MNHHELNERLAAYHLLKHPFYQDWMEGRLSEDQLRDYACQYFHHVEAFPRYISAIHSQCEEAAARRDLLENLMDEEGVTYGTSHPELWLGFARGLGVSEESVRASVPRDGIRGVLSTFFSLARRSYASGLGALYAYEAQVPEIAASKIEGLQTRYGIRDEATLSFFEVHKTADVGHREVLAQRIDALNDEQKSELFEAAESAAKSLWDFLTDVHGKTACVPA